MATLTPCLRQKYLVKLSAVLCMWLSRVQVILNCYWNYMYSLCESHRNLHRNTAPGEEALVDILAIIAALTSPFRDSWTAATSLGRHHASSMEACYVWLLLFYTPEPLPTIDFQLVGILSPMNGLQNFTGAISVLSELAL